MLGCGCDRSRYCGFAPSKVYYKGGVRLASSADAALVIIAIAAIDRIATLVPCYCGLPSSRSISAKG